jgi:hypothetical protein
MQARGAYQRRQRVFSFVNRWLRRVYTCPLASKCYRVHCQDELKPACSKSALRLAARKMQSRMEVRVAEKDKENESDCDEDIPIKPAVLNKHGGCSICNVSFTNLDLGNLVQMTLLSYCHSTATSTPSG